MRLRNRRPLCLANRRAARGRERRLRRRAVHQQRDGRHYVGFAPRVGRLDADALFTIAGLAESR